MSQQNRINSDRVSREIWKYFENNRQSHELLLRKTCLRDVLFRILKENFPDYEIDLKIVGSTTNGLGNNTSDVDICLIMEKTNKDHSTDENGGNESSKNGETSEKNNFEKLQELIALMSTQSKSEDENNTNTNDNESPVKTAKDDASLAMLELVKDILIKNGNFVSSPQVIAAKVPILKFVDRIAKIEVTLNINKSVSIRNTQLIYDYTKIDWRFQPLAMVIKSWAKEYGINDAHNKSISSYSLVLMVIHYLQFACHPPVLPSLQRLQPHKYNTNLDVKSIKLNSNVASLPRWKSYSNASLKDLFIGFLEYYSYQFPYSSMAISVRTGGTIPKPIVQRFKSEENSYGQWKYLCIEEPFNRSNTARSVYDGITFDRILSVFRVSHYTLRGSNYLASIMTIAKDRSDSIDSAKDQITYSKGSEEILKN